MHFNLWLFYWKHFLYLISLQLTCLAKILSCYRLKIYWTGGGSSFSLALPSILPSCPPTCLHYAPAHPCSNIHKVCLPWNLLSASFDLYGEIMAAEGGRQTLEYLARIKLFLTLLAEQNNRQTRVFAASHTHTYTEMERERSCSSPSTLLPHVVPP